MLNKKSLFVILLAAASLHAQQAVLPYTEVVPNDSSTGTTVNRFASKSSAGAAIISTAGNTSGVIGVVIDNAGTAGSAIIQKMGAAPIGIDADGSTTTGHYMTLSGSTNGKGTDAGASCPSSGQVLGFWTQTGSGAGTYSAVIDLTLCTGSSGSGTVTTSGSPANTQIAKFSSGTAITTATGADINTQWYVAGGGTAQHQTATYSPAIASLATGTQLCWLPIAANSGAGPDFAPNGLTAKTITKNGTAALIANDITTTAVACAIYDGTRWQLQNPQTSSSAISTSTNSFTSVWGQGYIDGSTGGDSAVAQVANQGKSILWTVTGIIKTTGVCYNVQTAAGAGAGLAIGIYDLALTTQYATVTASGTNVTTTGNQCVNWTGGTTTLNAAAYLILFSSDSTTLILNGYFDTSAIMCKAQAATTTGSGNTANSGCARAPGMTTGTGGSLAFVSPGTLAGLTYTGMVSSRNTPFLQLY